MEKMMNLLRQAIRYFGFDVHRFTPVGSNLVQLKKSIEYSGANYILDIGANRGQFGLKIQEMGLDLPILSFEPLSSVHSQLVNVAKRSRNWTVYKRVAIGDSHGKTTINIAHNSVSSSIFTILDNHVAAEPSSKTLSSEDVSVLPLDVAIGELNLFDKNFFIKIDTQGYEWNVLKGALKTLKNSVCVLCEVSIVPLYEGQRTWLEIIDEMEKTGFYLWAIQKGFTDPNTGQALQLDLIFMKR